MHRLIVVAVTTAAVIASLAATPGALAWIWPAEGPVLARSPVSSDPYAAGQHRGVDIGADLGRPVVAPAGGTVSFVGFVPGGGLQVTIATDDGYAVTLLQLGATSVERGSTLTEGTEVGVVGESSDAATLQPHVHLGVRIAADPNGYVDPLGLLPARQPAPAPPPSLPEPPVAAPPPAVTAEIPAPQPAPAEPTASGRPTSRLPTPSGRFVVPNAPAPARSGLSRPKRQ